MQRELLADLDFLLEASPMPNSSFRPNNSSRESELRVVVEGGRRRPTQDYDLHE